MCHNSKTACRNSNQTSKVKHMCHNCKTAGRYSNQTAFELLWKNYVVSCLQSDTNIVIIVSCPCNECCFPNPFNIVFVCLHKWQKAVNDCVWLIIRVLGVMQIFYKYTQIITCIIIWSYLINDRRYNTLPPFLDNIQSISWIFTYKQYQML